MNLFAFYFDMSSVQFCIWCCFCGILKLHFWFGRVWRGRPLLFRLFSAWETLIMSLTDKTQMWALNHFVCFINRALVYDLLNIYYLFINALNNRYMMFTCQPYPIFRFFATRLLFCISFSFGLSCAFVVMSNQYNGICYVIFHGIGTFCRS